MNTTPESEYSREFLVKAKLPTKFSTLMIQAMGVSFHKYGALRDAYPHKMRGLDNIDHRWRKYENSHNVAYLVDVANFAMIEYMFPSEPLVTIRLGRRGLLSLDVDEAVRRFKVKRSPLFLVTIAQLAAKEYEDPRYVDAFYDGGDAGDGRVWAHGGGVVRVVNNQGGRI